MARKIDDVLQEWKFFNISTERLAQECRGAQKVCACGPKAKCIQMELGAPTANSIDNTYTQELVEHMIDQDTYLPVLNVMNRHLTNYFRSYCEESGREYGKNLILSLKGGTVFSILVVGFLKAIKFRRPSSFVDRYFPMMKINDIDFEVFTDDTFDFSDIMKVAKLSVMAMYDVRSSLISSGVLHRLQKFSDGSDANHRLHSDNIVTPVTKPPPKCRHCNTLVMPVPSVLRSSDKKWYRPDWTGGDKHQRALTNLPISANHTLKRIFGADVLLFRMRKAVRNATPSAGSFAEIYDIAVPFHRDPIHKVLLSNSRRRWFVHSKRDDLYMCSAHYMYYTLRHTLFLENVAPWNVLKVEKKLARLVFCLIMVSVVEEKRSVPATLKACADAGRALSSDDDTPLQTGFFPIDEFIDDVRNSFKKFGHHHGMIQTICALIDSFSDALSARQADIIVNAEDLSFANVLRMIKRLRRKEPDTK